MLWWALVSMLWEALDLRLYLARYSVTICVLILQEEFAISTYVLRKIARQAQPSVFVLDFRATYR